MLKDPFNHVKMDKRVFWPVLIVLLAIIIPVAASKEAAATMITNAFNWSTIPLGWAYLVFCLFCFLVLLYWAAGRYGNVRLGGPDDEPEFKWFTWVAMLFCAGIGGGVLSWGFYESVNFLDGAPLDIGTLYAIDAAAGTGYNMVGSAKALIFEYAHMYPMFHWGFSAWAIYCIPTVPIAYMLFVRKRNVLRLSTACEPILGKYSRGPVGVIIDIFVVFGIVGAVGTTLAIAVPTVTGLAQAAFGLEVSNTGWIVYAVIGIWFAIFGTSVFLGLSKGIAKLSDINLYLALIFILYILIVGLFRGYTSFIFNLTTNSFGLMLSEFFRISLWTDPYSVLSDGASFPQWWTIFYWAWWLAYAPMMGLFVARISKGRTIRQLVVAELVWGTIGTNTMFAVMGGYSMFLEWTGTMPLTEALAELGNVGTIVAVLETLPLSIPLMVLYVVLLFIFVSTTIDSSAYTIASVCSKDLKAEDQPARWHRLFWAVFLAALAIVLYGLEVQGVIQTLSLVAAVPLIPIFVILVLSGNKMLKEDFGLDPKTTILTTTKYDEAKAK